MSSEPPSPEPLIILAIDALRASALGAYGQTTYGTPSFDRLAAEGELGEWRLTDSTDLATLYNALDAATGTRFESGASIIVSDDEALLRSAFAARFAERVAIARSEPLVPADSIDQTTQAATWSGFAERLGLALATLESGERPSMWFHSRAMAGPWDAPEGSYSDLVDAEEDPPVEASVAVPDARFADADAPDACDARFAASARYAGQVRTLAACLGGWLELADELLAATPWTLVVCGLRGFAMAEHGRLGLGDERLFSESTQVPLIVSRRGGGRSIDGMVRRQGVAKLSSALAEAMLAVPLPAGPVPLVGQAGAACVRNEEWMLRRPGDGERSAGSEPLLDELYVKPDDRWERNDVASLKPAEVEELARLLAPR
jgi:hypothetical protein